MYVFEVLVSMFHASDITTCILLSLLSNEFDRMEAVVHATSGFNHTITTREIVISCKYSTAVLYIHAIFG